MTVVIFPGEGKGVKIPPLKFDDFKMYNVLTAKFLVCITYQPLIDTIKWNTAVAETAV